MSASGFDAAIAALAKCQHGVVSRSQPAALGIGRGAIGHRLERGRLHLVHRGVFAVGHRLLSREGYWLAAVLAVGPNAALERAIDKAEILRLTSQTSLAELVDRHTGRPGTPAIWRITWRQLHARAAAVAAELRTLLAPQPRS